MPLSSFTYAFLRPRTELSPRARRLKEAAKKILSRIEDGEEVATTVVHVAEAANILESRLPVLTSLGYARLYYNSGEYTRVRCGL